MTTETSRQKAQEIAKSLTHEGWQEMNAKVKASNTYAHSYYVIKCDYSGRNLDYEEPRYQVMACGLSAQDAKEAAKELQRTADRLTKGKNDIILFFSDNIFDSYLMYQRGAGPRHAKADLWQAIKESTVHAIFI